MSYHFMKQRVIIPSGKCPVPLENTDEDSVLNWIEKIEELYPEKKFLSTSFRYWARQIFFGEPDKINKVVSVINESLDTRSVFYEMKNSQ